MKDSTLLRISLTTTIIGLISLFIILQTVELEETSFDSLNDKDEDEIVKIKGVIEKVTNKAELTIITLSQKVLLKGVIFENITLSKGLEVEVIGRVSNYNGEKEILIEKISIGHSS